MTTAALALVLAAWPAPLAEALAPRSDEEVSFELFVSSGDFEAAAMVDTGTEPALTILRSSGEDDEARRHIEKDHADALRGEIWCDAFAEQVPDDVEVLEESGTSVTYRYPPLPSSAKDRGERKFLENAVSTMSVTRAGEDEPWRVADVVMTIERPFKPNVFAKVTGFELRFTCETAPGVEGRAYVAHRSMVLDIRAATQRMTMEQIREIANVRRR